VGERRSKKGEGGGRREVTTNPCQEEEYRRNNLEPPPLRILKSWKTPEEVRKYFEFLGKKLHIDSPDDWYRVGGSQISRIGGKISGKNLCDFWD
jgi:hypothetical protein